MDAPAVITNVHYLAPEATVLRRFTAPGASVNTGICRAHRMPVRDARKGREEFVLDRNGFTLIDHVSAVRDFTDSDEVDRV